jgi:hypothetical protein
MAAAETVKEAVMGGEGKEGKKDTHTHKHQKGEGKEKEKKQRKKK